MSGSSPLAATGKSPILSADFKSEFPSELITQMGILQAHILLVEDSDDGVARYAQHLTKKGYRVSKAHRGEVAFEMALRLTPDLIILHLLLPKINGWELTRLLKSDERTRNIPVVVLAGQALVQSRKCERFRREPFQLDELGEEIVRRIKAFAPLSPQPVCA